MPQDPTDLKDVYETIERKCDRHKDLISKLTKELTNYIKSLWASEEDKDIKEVYIFKWINLKRNYLIVKDGHMIHLMPSYVRSTTRFLGFWCTQWLPTLPCCYSVLMFHNGAFYSGSNWYFTFYNASTCTKDRMWCQNN